MPQSSFQAVFILCCCVWVAAALATVPSTCQLDAAATEAPLQFVTIVRAGGCPLTLYFPSSSSSSSSSIREAYLAPALCLTQNLESVLKTACQKTDPLFKNSSYLSIPVTVSSSSLLAEAQETLRPLLSDRKLIFLQPLSIRETEDSELPLMLHTELDLVETALVRVQCRSSDCLDLYSNSGIWKVLEEVQLKVTLRVPGSKPITMTSGISVANQSRDLKPPTSPSVLPAQICTNLEHHQTIMVDSSCDATVLQRTDKPGHFLIEPMLCYSGNHTTGSEFDEDGGAVRVTLEVKNNHVRDAVNAALGHLSPASVAFMSTIVSVELKVSQSLSQWRFDSLRLSPEDDRAELTIRCDSGRNCRQLGSQLASRSSDLWRHVTFVAESQLRDAVAVCSWKSHTFAAVFNDSNTCQANASAYHSSFHAITGLLCVRPEYVQQIAMLSNEDCAIRCRNSLKCQAFSTDRGSCQLFLFDKCSKNVRDCACDKRGRVFVKRQPGLEPGQLCPTGYGDDLCGVKYRAKVNANNWNHSRQLCEGEPGLVIMADVMDAAELRRAASVYTRERLRSMWLGGFQTPGSIEPAGGWHWVACNLPVSMDSSLWAAGEPNNYQGSENAIEIVRLKLNDNAATMHPGGVLCECVSPFD